MSSTTTAAVQLDENRGPAILGACATMTVLALVVVITRLYVRMRMIRSVGWDDYFIIASMVLSFGGMMIIIPEVSFGGGRHKESILADPNLGGSALINGLRLNFITQPIYLFSITFVKVSIALFLLRFAPGRGYKAFLWGMQVFMAVYTIFGFSTIVAQCKPLSVLWDPSVPAVCFSNSTLQTLAYVNAAFGIVSDIVFAVLPVPMLWNVQVNSRVKLALFAIMSLGIFASAASLVKLYYITTYGITGDFLYDSANLTIWTVVECNVGILAASIPCLKPLFKAILHGSSYYTNKYGPGGSKSNRNTHGYAQQNASGSRTHKGSVQRSNNKEEFEMFHKHATGGKGNTIGVTVTSTHRRKGDMDIDNISEESILPLQDFGGRGIIKTTQVQITHGAADETSRPRSVEDRV